MEARVMRYERVNRYLDSSFRVKLSDSGYDSRTRICRFDANALSNRSDATNEQSNTEDRRATMESFTRTGRCTSATTETRKAK